MKKNHLSTKQKRSVKSLLLDNWDACEAFRNLIKAESKETLSRYLDHRMIQFYTAESRLQAAKVLRRMDERSLNYLFTHHGRIPKIARRIEEDLYC